MASGRKPLQARSDVSRDAVSNPDKSNKESGLKVLRESTLRSSLLFVNNDAATMSKGKPKPSTDIKTHVMLQSSRKKRLDAIERLRRPPAQGDSRSPRCTCLKGAKELCSACRCSSYGQTNKPRNDPSSGKSLDTESPTEEAVVFKKEERTTIDWVEPMNRKYGPQNLLGGASDPFESAVIPLNPRMKELFYFYVTVQLPIGYALNRATRRIPSMNETLGSAALLYSIFAICAGHMEAYSGRPSMTLMKHGDKESIIPESLAHNLACIALINKAFSDPKERLSHAVYDSLKAICRSEILSSNRRAANIHFQGLQRLCEARGSSQSELFWDIAIVDVHMACTLDAPPMLPMIYSIEDELEWAKVEVDTLEDDDMCATEKLKLHPDVQKIVHPRAYPIYEDIRFINLHRDLRWRQGKDTTSATVGDDTICFKRTLLLDYRLAALSLLPDPWVEGDWERAFRIATLVFTFSTSMGHDPSNSRTRYPSLRLMGTLYKTDLDALWTSAPSALLWILFIGAYATQGNPERPFFVGHIEKGAMTLGIRSWPEARSILVRFFYLPCVHDGPFQQIWEEASVSMMSTNIEDRNEVAQGMI